jgi:hypothetical protein
MQQLSFLCTYEQSRIFLQVNSNRIKTNCTNQAKTLLIPDLKKQLSKVKQYCFSISFNFDIMTANWQRGG